MHSTPMAISLNHPFPSSPFRLNGEEGNIVTPTFIKAMKHNLVQNHTQFMATK